MTPERVVMIYVPGPPGETTERIASTLQRR